MKTISLLTISCALFSFSACTNVDSLKCEHILNLQPGPEFGKDAFLHTEFPDRTHGNAADIPTMAWTFYALGEDEGLTRSLLQFDLSSIPHNAEIRYAKLSLYNNPYSNNSQGEHSSRSGSNEVDIHQVLEEWAEHSVTWNNQPSIHSAPILTLAQSTDAHQDYEDINLTSTVKYWFDNPDKNHGIMMKMQTEQHYRCVILASSDNSVAELRPKLTINYYQ